MGNWAAVGRGGRLLIAVVGMTVLGFLLRGSLTALGVVGAGLIMPLFLVVPWLILGWYQQKERQPPACPNCELPLSFRRLGPSHGMLECPSMCGYRKLVGEPGRHP